MRSVMDHSFSRVPNVEIQRSAFDRSHGHKTTFDAGYLVPVYLDEALPGDTFNCNMSAFARMSTPTYPVMDNMYMETFFFAVPVRLVWDNFQKFMGEQTDPGDSIDYLVPTITSVADIAENSLSDYMGIPTGRPDLEFSSLFHRAYNLIWNEWFRDQNLQDSVVVDKDDGPDALSDYVLLRRGKRHDYFTSALPWPQKGDSVEVPLGATAPVQGIGFEDVLFTYNNGTNETVWETDNPSTQTYVDSVGTDGLSHVLFELDDTDSPDLKPMIYADLSAASASTINQLRQSFQIQRLLEKDARGGTRYTEIVKSHFGVTSPDMRLQRPEYLGGGSTPINVNPVPYTAALTSPVSIFAGDLGAYATTAINNHGFTKSFTEHCLLIGLANVRADITYQQGMNRMFSRSTRYDFFWPSLANIGEQTILNKEIYAQGSDHATNDDEVFGYQERYAEYRYKPSMITGEFRSNAATTLDPWHLSQEFSSLPSLDSTFIEDNPPLDRVIATPGEPHFIYDSYFKMRCVRPMPMYGVPGMIDHF